MQMSTECIQCSQLLFTCNCRIKLIGTVRCKELLIVLLMEMSQIVKIIVSHIALIDVKIIMQHHDLRIHSYIRMVVPYDQFSVLACHIVALTFIHIFISFSVGIIEVLRRSTVVKKDQYISVRKINIRTAWS